MSTAAEIALSERECGLARNGEVHLRDFDRGVVETMGGVIVDGKYYLVDVPGVLAPPGMPGVPINFSFPEDTQDVYVFPMIVVTRQDISPAMNRYHPGTQQYRVPAKGARPVEVKRYPNEAALKGWNRMAERPAAIYYDIMYQVMVLGYRRGTPARGNANALLEYFLAAYQPYTGVYVIDSIGDRRLYFATTDAASPMDDAAVVGERIIGWSISMNVEAELDLNPELTYTTVQSMALNLKVI